MDTKINIGDIKWLEEEFPKYKGKPLDGVVLNAYYLAEKLLKGNPTIHKRGCTCQYGSLANEVNTLYRKFLND